MHVFCYGHHEFLPMAAMAEGIKACGHRITYRSHAMYKGDCYEPCDVAVVFGMKEPVPLILAHQRAHGTPVVVMDMGYVHRGNILDARQNPARVYWSVGLNGLNGFADCDDRSLPGDRWELLGVDLKPWREDGRHILVCGQLLGDAMVEPIDPKRWAEDAIAQLRTLTDRPIRYRPHPLDHTKPLSGVENSKYESLTEDLQDCWAVIAFNSTALTESIIAGVPAFVLGQGSMVDAVASKDLAEIEQPLMPDRTAWAHALAYRQWTLTEMRSGVVWQHLFDRKPIAEGTASARDSLHVLEEQRKDGTDHAPRGRRAQKSRVSGGVTRESELPAA